MNKFESKIEDIYAALLRGEATSAQMVRRTQISSSAVKSNLNRLRDAGRAHIARWEPGSPPVRVWVSGPGPDAVKPAPLTPAEVRWRHMEKQRARREDACLESGDRVASGAKAQTYAFIERLRSAPQSWCSPLVAA